MHGQHKGIAEETMSTEMAHNNSFDITLITELTLGIPGHHGSSYSSIQSSIDNNNEKKLKRGVSEIINNDDENLQSSNVGWPPVCSYRKKTCRFDTSTSVNESATGGKKKMKMMMYYVKVCMDGVPFLRKIDVSAYNGYSDFLIALDNLFFCFGIGEPLKNLEIIYEDKDGEWMPLGNVPWEIFRSSCKRLKIGKGTKA